MEGKPFVGGSGLSGPSQQRDLSQLCTRTDGFGHTSVRQAGFENSYGMIEGKDFNKGLKPYQMTSLMPSFDSGFVDPYCNPADGCKTMGPCSRNNNAPGNLPPLYYGSVISPERAYPVGCGLTSQTGAPGSC